MARPTSQAAQHLLPESRWRWGRGMTVTVTMDVFYICTVLGILRSELGDMNWV